MKLRVELIDVQKIKPRKIIMRSEFDGEEVNYNKFKIEKNDNFGWVVNVGWDTYLTPQELRLIANKLEQYNKEGEQ